MFCRIFTRKMAMVVLSFLVVLMIAAIAYTQEDKFPIITYGGLHYEYFPQIMDCNFNTVFYWEFNESDFVVADTMGLHLIGGMYRNATHAQWSRYESDFNRPDSHFSHSDVIGRELRDEMPDPYNDYAWVAQVSSDPAGWMQRGLLWPYKWDQEIPTYRYPGYDLEYYAHFRMRLAPDAVDPSAPIARIDAVRLFRRDTLVAVDSLWYSDFDTAGALGQYADFTISFERARLDSGVMDYRVYWYGNTDLWVDRVVLEDERYDSLMAGDYDDTIRSLVNLYSNYQEALFRWYLEDEPRRDQFPASAYVRVFLDTITNPPTVPGVQACYGDPLSNPGYFSDYLDVVKPNELNFDWYPIVVYADTATDTDVDSTSLQRCWDEALPRIKAAKEIAKDRGKPFWYCPQTFEQWIDSSGTWVSGSHRYPTNNELKCNVWLGLCCGAKGLFYFRYASYSGGPNGKGDFSDTLYQVLEGQITFPSKGKDWIGGLVRWDGNTYAKVETYSGDTLWNAVQDMNAVVDSLGNLLLNLTWVDEGRWDEVSSLTGSYITSITSEQYPDTSVYVEVGLFHDDLYDYFMLVNRRCLSTETQTVTATLNLTQGECYTVKDMYSGDETILFNETGTVDFTTTLDPGQGKLFRLREGAYLTTHHTWSGTDTIHCNYTIAPSGTLTIQPGATLRFASGKKLIVEGALIAEGTETDKITFTSAQASPDKGDWMWIEFSPGSENTSVLRHCVIEWGTYGVWCSNSSPTLDDNLIQDCLHAGIECGQQASPVITNNTVKWCGFGAEFSSSNPLLEGNDFNHNDVGIALSSSYSPSYIIKDNNFNNNDLYGVWLDSYSSPTIYRCEIKDNDDIGVMCINHSSPDMDSCRVEDNGSTGLYCSSSSSPILAYRPRPVGYPEHAYNWIKGNAGSGIYATVSSYPDLGSYHKPDYYPGNNCIYDNTSYEVVNANSSGWIWAQYNFWGYPVSQHPDSSDFSGLVIWEPYLLRDPRGPMEPLGKRGAPAPDSTDPVENLTQVAEGCEVRCLYEEAMEAYKQIVSEYSASKQARYSLDRIILCYQNLDREPEIVPYLENVAEDCADTGLKGFALEQSVYFLQRGGEYGKALTRCDYLMENYEESMMQENLLFQRGLIYRYGLRDKVKAEEVFTQFIEVYPNSIRMPIAQIMLGQPVSPPQPKQRKEKVQVPEEFSLSQNYPNPFNPVTHIKYALPEDCWVRLGIYNLLGQRVVTLANEKQKAGYKTVKWDAGSFSSGIYFYRLQAGDFMQTRKMVLIR